MNTSKVIVIDGGFSTQLSTHVSETIFKDDPLWTARLNVSQPDLIIQTHLDFLNAGADAILTNTYQASVEGYAKYLQLTQTESVELIKSTVRLAHEARSRFISKGGKDDVRGGKPWIVGSIGSYGAHLHDASEYNGKYLVTGDTIKNWHNVRIAAVVEAGVDALAIETIPCKVEADVLLDLLSEKYPNTKFWISFQCRDNESMAHGENFADTVRSLWNKSKTLPNHKNLIAIGANCLLPKYISSLFRAVNGSCSPIDRIPLITYPNSGEVYDVKHDDNNDGWSGKANCIPLDYHVAEWVQLGTRLVGGCCRIGASDIQRIKRAVDEINNQQ